jgi:hypothetical protein
MSFLEMSTFCEHCHTVVAKSVERLLILRQGLTRKARSGRIFAKAIKNSCLSPFRGTPALACGASVRVKIFLTLLQPWALSVQAFLKLIEIESKDLPQQ